MSRPLVALVAVLVILIGALFFFAGRNGETPPVPVEKVVPLANLQK